MDLPTKIAQLIGIEPVSILPLNEGATSVAWRVSDDFQTVIVRTMRKGTNRPVTYQSEFTILRYLQAAKALVPQPILNSFERGYQPVEGTPWSVTAPVPGYPLGNDELPLSVAEQLGCFLATLHQLPVTGVGRLEEGITTLVGQEQRQINGILGRWCWATLWPFDGSQLQTHPIVRFAPDLLEQLLTLRPALLKLADESHVVLNHADLHGEHVFLQDGKLMGVIDFGAAFIGSSAWEFAVLAYYHGLEASKAVMQSYIHHFGETPLVYEELWQHTQEISVVVTLYKIAKAYQPPVAMAKIERGIIFLDNVLEQLGCADFEVEP